MFIPLILIFDIFNIFRLVLIILSSQVLSISTFLLCWWRYRRDGVYKDLWYIFFLWNYYSVHVNFRNFLYFHINFRYFYYFHIHFQYFSLCSFVYTYAFFWCVLVGERDSVCKEMGCDFFIYTVYSFHINFPYYYYFHINFHTFIIFIPIFDNLVISYQFPAFWFFSHKFSISKKIASMFKL